MEARHNNTMVLDIYVGPHCFGCDTAHVIARKMGTLELPGVEIRVIDLSDPATVRPASVFAVPTYLLNGKVISLGNPEFDWLRDQLTDFQTGMIPPDG